MKPKPNYILLTSAILSLAAGILGMVGASKMPELQADLPGSDETAQKGKWLLANVHSIKMPC